MTANDPNSQAGGLDHGGKARRTRRRTIVRRIVVLIAAGTAVASQLTVLFGSTQGSEAAFSAAKDNASSAFTTLTLSTPTALTAKPLGAGVGLTWSGGNGAGYVISRSAGSSSSCPTTAVIASSTANSYTDATPGAAGSWDCYQVATSDANWTSTASSAVAVQVGFVATALSMSGTDTGADFVATFNQPVSSASRPRNGDTVCIDPADGIVLLASTTKTGACTTHETTAIGTVNGVTGSGSSRYLATYTWDADGTTLTITLGTLISGTGLSGALAVTGGGTFTPATSLTSATGGVPVCTTIGLCTPMMTING